MVRTLLSIAVFIGLLLLGGNASGQAKLPETTQKPEKQERVEKQEVEHQAEIEPGHDARPEGAGEQHKQKRKGRGKDIDRSGKSGEQEIETEGAHHQDRGRETSRDRGGDRGGESVRGSEHGGGGGGHR